MSQTKQNADYKCSPVMRDFLFYMETIKGRSPRTVHGYYVDLRTFFRFINLHRGYVPTDIEFEDIGIDNIDIDIIKAVTLSETYEFLHYVSRQRSNAAVTRARKVCALRMFFKYLTNNKKLLNENPLKDLEVPSAKKSLPKYLTLEESIELMRSVDGKFKERDYCIITLFLNCGMRLSELVGLNHSDIRDNTLKVLGKGNKERIVYLNQACLDALSIYTNHKNANYSKVQDKNAIFLNSSGTRIKARRVEQIVEECLKRAGLSGKGYSTHKLRHTAATLMYQHGNVDIKVLQEILGHVNLGTTEIYTHVSSSRIEEASNKNPLANIKMKK